MLRFFHPVLQSGALRHLALSTVCLLLLTLSSTTYAVTASTGEAKRIEVYPLSQSFHDVARGETLQQIVLQLLPNRPAQQTRLMRDIVQLNPSAFINQNPNRLKAGVRLWLPNNPPGFAPQYEPGSVYIDSFSWGQVIRRQSP